MKTQEAMLVNSISQVEEANYLNNRGYVFQPNINFPTHYHPGLQNHENLSYGSQEIIPHVPHQLSVSNVSPGFQGKGASSSSSNNQGQGALSSNNQGQRRPSFFEENILYLLNDMKKNNDNRLANLEMTQSEYGSVFKELRESNGAVGHHSMKESSSRSFPSDTEKNLKDCMAITLQSGKDLGNSKNGENGKAENEKMVDDEVNSKKVEDDKVEAEKQEIQSNKKKEEREENKYTLGNVLFPNKPPPPPPPTKKKKKKIPPLSFPSRFRKVKLDGQFTTFFNMFKKLEVNIPFAEALA